MNKPKGQYTLEEQDEMLKEVYRIVSKLENEWKVNIFHLDMHGNDFWDSIDEIRVDVEDARQKLYRIKESKGNLK